VVCAIVIGILQLLSLILNTAHPTGRFWDGVETAGEYYEVIGGAICASFVVFGGISVLCYKPWKRRVGRRREKLRERALALGGSAGVGDHYHDSEIDAGGGQGTGEVTFTSYDDDDNSNHGVAEVRGQSSVERIDLKANDGKGSDRAMKV
jgi:high-affinity nickel-transport protein